MAPAQALRGTDCRVLVGGVMVPDRAINIALRLGHPIYDCLYLACAEWAGPRLVTADELLLATRAGTPPASRAAHIDAYMNG